MWDHRRCDMPARFVRLNARSESSDSMCRRQRLVDEPSLHGIRLRFPPEPETGKGEHALSRVSERVGFGIANVES